MKKIFKIFSITVSALLVLLVVSFIAITVLINPNDFKGKISKLVEQKTGREFTIAGNISWRFFPWLGIKVEDATLGNAPGFKQPYFAKVGEADVSLRLIPLLSGKIEAGTLQVKKANLFLVVNQSGKNNWDDLRASFESDSKTPAVTNTADKNSNAVLNASISGIEIDDASVYWDDQANQEAAQITNLDFHVNSFTLAKPFTVDAKFNWKFNKNKQLVNQGYATLDSDVTVNMEKKYCRLNNLSLLGNIKMSSMAKAMTYGITGDFMLDFDKAVIKVPNLQIVVNDSTLQGTVDSLDLTNKKLTFFLKLDDINVDQYLPADGKKNNVKSSSGAAKASGSNSSGGAASANGGGFEQWKIKGKLDIGRLTVSHMLFTKISLPINVNKAVISVQPKADFYQGTIDSQVSFDIRSATPKISTNLALKNVNIGPLVKDLSGSASVDGTANFSLIANTSGYDGSSMVKNLNGKGSLEAINGDLKFIDINSILTFANSILNIAAAPVNIITSRQLPTFKQGSSVTKFDKLSATYTITDGVIANKDLLLSARDYKITGQGTVNLNNQKVDYMLKATSAKVTVNKKDLGVIEVPVKVSGTFSNIHYYPDTKQLLKMLTNVDTLKSLDNMVNEGLKQGGENLQSIGKSISKIGKNLGL